MLNVKHLQHHVDDLVLERLSRQTSWTLARNFSLERKVKCLANSESWVVVLVLLAVNSFTTVSLLEEVGFEGAIENFAVDVGISITLVADDLEESSATATRATENKTHLSWLEHTLEVVQNVELLALLTKSQKALSSGEDIEEGDERVRESLSEH